MSDPVTPNMNLTLPGVAGTQNPTPGPIYANEFNDNMTKVDTHNHTSGGDNGVPIPGEALAIGMQGINFNDNESRNQKATQFFPQSSPLDPGANPGRLFIAASGGSTTIDLWFNDGSGNAIQVTKNGALIAATSAAGWAVLSGGAHVDYTGGHIGGGTYSFWQNVGILGSLLIGHLKLCSASDNFNTNGVTFAVPNGLGTNYTWFIPGQVAPATSFLQMTPGGIIQYRKVTIPTRSGTGAPYSNKTNIFTNVGLVASLAGATGRAVQLMVVSNPTALAPGWTLIYGDSLSSTFTLTAGFKINWSRTGGASGSVMAGSLGLSGDIAGVGPWFASVGGSPSIVAALILASELDGPGNYDFALQANIAFGSAGDQAAVGLLGSDMQLAAYEVG